MGRVAKLWRLADRTAVLAVGVVAGFAIGLSFNAGGRERIGDWFQPRAPVRPAAPPSPVPAATPDMTAGIDPRVLKRVAADGRLRIGVFGDSFGNGIWDALYHQLPPGEHYDVLRFSKESTGFTRYHSLDLEERAREQVGHQPIDVAVICFGANDLQPIFEEHRLQPLLGDDWKRIIGARIDRFVAVARSTGAMTFWVGLPVMRDADTDGQLQHMNAFYAERMRALKVPFVETRAASLDPDGHYNAHLVDAATGKAFLVRTPDGMHMTGAGYQRLTAGIAGQVRRYAALARRHAGMPVEAIPSRTQDRPTPQANGGDRPARHHDSPAPPADHAPLAATPDSEAGQTARANRREQDQVKRRESAERPSPVANTIGNEQ